MRTYAADPAIVTDDCSIASIRHVFASHERLFKYYKNVNNNINKQYSQNAKIGVFTIKLDCVIFDYYMDATAVSPSDGRFSTVCTVACYSTNYI